MQKSGKVKSQAGTEAPGGYELDAQVGFLLRVAMQRHTSIFMSHMVDELTQTQFAVMAKLHEVGPSSQNHLGRLVYLDAATIKGVVDRLGLRGFVATGADPNDRRRRAVSLTEKGSRVVEAAIRVAADVTTKTLRPLTVDEQRTLTRLLKKIT
ncbi:MarR family transcriptional regulator [Tardiphaga alba]|uniref:MarR family transcriptional regulator n=1 Tax=Tardiphaga alba TaxID=340268 RepID=A0ABX8A9K4_9BRAD|nr:MarR family winged helix-turn-helix transcriptional regulator [Tardiphaga alba]QUS39349.1 MarR family transcriptional regulator [Tardiphaga alba]